MPNMQDYLMHYGTKGQKWGVRRYQNEDGTLTAEGRERYGHLEDRGDQGVIKKWTLGSEGGEYAFAKWRERRHTKNLNKWQSRVDGSNGRHAKSNADLKNVMEHPSTKDLFSDSDKQKLQGIIDKDKKKDMTRAEKKVAKYQSKLDAQSAANANLDAYRRHSKTSKLVIQNSILSPTVGNSWRHARARGESRLGAFLEVATPVGWILRMERDKKAYGKYIVFADPAVNEYDANGMRD